MQPAEIELDVFGDESVGDEVVSYGLLAVPTVDVPTVEGLLAITKQDFGGTASHKLHCREMFSGDARLKSPWAHLNSSDVFSLYERLARQISDAGLRRIACVARTGEFPSALPAEGGWPKIVLGGKQLAAFCGNGAMIPLSRNPGMHRLRFWADPDSTPIAWFGGRRRATGALSAFFDHGIGEPPRLATQPIIGEKPPLLEIADFVAYASQRGQSRRYGAMEQRFKALCSSLAPELLEFTRSPDGGFGIRVPNQSLQR